jgi:hypothetical protein
MRSSETGKDGAESAGGAGEIVWANAGAPDAIVSHAIVTLGKSLACRTLE